MTERGWISRARKLMARLPLHFAHMSVPTSPGTSGRLIENLIILGRTPTRERARPAPKPWRLKPDAAALAARKKPHRFEEAHDDPAGSNTCWTCLLPRGHKVHRP